MSEMSVMSVMSVMRSFRRLTFLLSLATLGAFAGGCRGPVDVCKKSCEKSGACLGSTSGQIADCKTQQCDNQSAQLNSDAQKCKNEGDVLSCQDGCLNQPCNDILGCLGGCPKCVQ